MSASEAPRYALEAGGKRYPLAEGENLVGRSPECSVRLPQVTASRRHLLLRVAGDTVTVTDLGSHNGTWINRTRLRPGATVAVTTRDRIYLPALAFRLVRDTGQVETASACPAQTAVGAAATTAEQPLSRCRSAGSPRRIAATLVDMVLFAILSFGLMLPLLLRSAADTGGTATIERLATFAGDSSWLHLAIATFLAWIVLWWAYFIVGWGFLGATPGQRLFRLRVVDHCGRYPIGPARAALRLVAYCVGSLPLCAGHLSVLFRADCRALHDVLAGTRVVRLPRLAAAAGADSQARPFDTLGGDGMTRNSSGVLLLVVGVLLFLVSLTADGLGIGSSPGIGRWQLLGAAVGVVAAATGMLRLKR